MLLRGEEAAAAPLLSVVVDPADADAGAAAEADDDTGEDEEE
jgi:hypothetical protein